MTGSEPQYLEVGQGERRRIAYLASEPAHAAAPGVVWYVGLKSDMESTKATALAQWAQSRGLGCTRFDYSGHGRSGGRFEDATIGDWLEEAETVFTKVTKGLQFLVGSSTGAHIALLLLRRLMNHNPPEAERIKGLVLIAPAWDLTEELMWKVFPEAVRREIMSKGQTVRPSDYDAAGYTITRRFIEEGRNHLFSGRPFNPGRPVAILQGLRDTDVPPAHARALLSILTGNWATLTEVPDGDHRLSRPEDIELMLSLVVAQIERTA